MIVMKLHNSNLKSVSYQKKSDARFGRNEAVEILIRKLLMNTNGVCKYRDQGVENFKRFKFLNTSERPRYKIGSNNMVRKCSMCISSTHI